MRKAMMAVMALCLAAPGARAQQNEQQAAQRRELEQKMQQLEQQMRDLQRELARMAPEEGRLRAMPPAPVFPLFNRAHLGVYLNSDKSAATDSIGALLTAITPGGPADQAGLKTGDIITTFNGEKLAGSYPAADEDESAPGIKLRDLAGDLSDGDTVQVDYRRGRETRHTAIVARNLSESWGFAVAGPSPRVYVDTRGISDAARRMAEAGTVTAGIALPHILGEWMYDRWFDMELVALNAELGDYFGTSTGLLVIRPPDDSTLNLKAGDVILAVDGRKPASQAQLVRILRSYAPGEAINVDIVRHQRRMTVTARIPERHGPPDDDFDWESHGIMR
jgi:S1-C subfamily serine protease